MLLGPWSRGFLCMRQCVCRPSSHSSGLSSSRAPADCSESKWGLLLPFWPRGRARHVQYVEYIKLRNMVIGKDGCAYCTFWAENAHLCVPLM